jgi:hypothetical protein
MEPRALNMLGNHSTAELYTNPVYFLIELCSYYGVGLLEFWKQLPKVKASEAKFLLPSASCLTSHSPLSQVIETRIPLSQGRS